MERAELVAVEITEVSTVERLRSVGPAHPRLPLVAPTERQRFGMYRIDVGARATGEGAADSWVV